MSNKRLLQCAVIIAGFVPVLAGGAGVLVGAGMAGGDALLPISTDSHFRYLSGLLLGIGLVFWSLVPEIEKHTAVFRALAAVVFFGGLGRLYALFTAGVPDNAMLFGLVMELVITPLLALWQAKIAQSRAPQ